MLLKNALKLFSKKKFQLISVAIIIFLSSFLYTAMYNTMNSLDKSIKEYFSKYNQEDFSISMLDTLTEEERKLLSIKEGEINPLLTLGDIKKNNLEDYNKIINFRKESFLKEYEGYELELRESKNVTFNYEGKGIKLKVFKDAERINLSKIEKGRKPVENNEIALTSNFIKKNNLKIGDKIDINNKEYTLVGVVLFPDYTLPMFGMDFIMDSGKLNVALFSKEGFESLKEKEELTFSGKALDNFNKESFNNEVQESYRSKNSLSYITSISQTTENVRSGMIYTEVLSGKVAILFISIIISTIAIIIVAIIVYKILQGEKCQIGVLKAMGYLNKEIARPYLGIIGIIAFPMLIIGAIGGIFASKPLRAFYEEFYILPKDNITISFSVIIVAIFIPLIFFLGLSYFIIMKMLNKRALDLLKVGDENKTNVLTKFADKILAKAKTTTKFKYSFLLRSPGKFFLFFIGIVFSSMLVILGLMMPGFFSKMATDKYERVKYNYEAYLDVTKSSPELKEGQEKFLSLSDGKFKGNVITIKGLEKDNKLYNLFNKKNKNITEKLEKGAIVNKSFSELYNVKAGDEILVTINNIEHKLKIIDINNEYSDAIIYLEREKLSKLISENKNEDLYTGIYSEEEINKEDYEVVISKKDILNQAISMEKIIYISIGGMLVSAIFIAALVLYVLTSLTVEDNYYNISLLKVMGYNKKEVNSMILNGYLGYGIIAYILSLPITSITISTIMNYLARDYKMVLPLEFELWQGFVGLIIILIIFYIGTVNGKKKMNKISLQQILKAYTE